jgi:hypothetical protein
LTAANERTHTKRRRAKKLSTVAVTVQIPIFFPANMAGFSSMQGISTHRHGDRCDEQSVSIKTEMRRRLVLLGSPRNRL